MSEIKIITTGDTYVDKQKPNNNFETTTLMGSVYGMWPDFIYDKRVFLHFPTPVTPSGLLLESALLYIYVYTSEQGARTIYVPTANWSPSSLTWNNQPSLGAVLVGYDLHYSSQGWQSVNIINFVNGWIANDYQGSPFPNYGIVLAKGWYKTTTDYFYASERAGFEPYMQLHYTGPGSGEYIGNSYIID